MPLTQIELVSTEQLENRYLHVDGVGFRTVMILF